LIRLGKTPDSPILAENNHRVDLTTTTTTIQAAKKMVG
jgi:hypothetical protein